jgi:hypothetical protein
MGFNVTVTPQVQEVEVSVSVQPYEVQVTANQDLVDYVNEAKQSADEAEASAILADNSADNALASATSATASASSASASASSASSSASTATTQAGIATTKANEASQSASNALASEQASAISEGNALASEQASAQSEANALSSEQNALASEQASALSASNALASENSASASASTATSQAGIATTQAGIATTQAGNALISANNAEASAAAAAQTGTSTLLTGFSVGANTSIAGTDSILSAFNKTQGQINERVSGSGTINFLPKFTASGTVGNSRIRDDGTNISFFTSTTRGKIYIFHDSTSITEAQSALMIGGSTINGTAQMIFGTNITGGYSYLYGMSRGTSLAGTLVINSLGGLVGIATTSPTNTLDVNGTGRIRNGVSLADISGNVLIGTTTNAGFRLDVNGTARVQSTLKVGAATSTNDSAVLDVESTTRGFLPPRMTTAERDAIASPVAGLVIYNNSTNKHQGYDGTTWNDFY